MRLILEARSGPSSGRKIWLGSGQVVEVGRTEDADVTMPRDSHMSSRHFALECGDKACRVRDLNSTNGTFVNGERVTEATLRNGDTILAGQTTFVVQIETAAGSDFPADVTSTREPAARFDSPDRIEPPLASAGASSAPPQMAGEGDASTGHAGPADSATDVQTRRTAEPDAGPTHVKHPPDAIPEQSLPPAPEESVVTASPSGALQGAVLEVRSGTSMGRKTWLHPGGSVTVGRTELADFVLAEDGRLSGRHFALSCGVQACRLRDLESANGTFLNGQNVEEETDLYDGDEIQAGQTTFVVRVRGGPPRPTDRLAPGAIRPSGALLPDGSPATALPEEALEYEEVRCPSGLVLLRGTASELDPAVIGRRLSLLMPLYLIVDFEKLARPLPDGLSEPVYLFDWLPEEVARDCSPVILGPAEEDAQFSLVGEAWGRDSLTCVYSKRDKPSLFQHLREIASGKKASGGRTQGQVLGHCWPSVVMQAFANGSPDFVAHVFSALDATMLEVHGGERWGLFCQTGMAGTLQGVGFRPAGG